MRILALFTSKKICDFLKEIASRNKAIQYDCVEEIKDLEYYLDIRNYDFVILNTKEVGVELLEILNNLSNSTQNTQTLYLKSESMGKLNNLERAELLNKGIVFSIDEDENTIDYLETIFNNSFKILKNDRIIRVGKLLVDTENNYVLYDQREIILEGKPFEVFVFLLGRKNEIITKEELLHNIWVDPELVTPSVIDVCIKVIRDKIDSPLNITTIEHVRGRGFRFVLKDQ